MEIRPEALERLLFEDDTRFWETIRRIAAMNNVTLPTTPPSHADMEKLRALLRSGALGYEDAVRILRKNGQGDAP